MTWVDATFRDMRFVIEDLTERLDDLTERLDELERIINGEKKEAGRP